MLCSSNGESHICGLIGIAGDTDGNIWKDIFSELLLVDSVRGLHSTGAGFVKRDDNPEFRLAKEVGHPFRLFHNDEYEKNMARAAPSWQAILGHNRHATLGEHTIENAHPFMFDNIIGMHNGTLERRVLRDLLDHDKFGTDSEAIFNDINSGSVQETVAKLEGAWALVWFDRRDNTLNFLRNDKRPLHYCYTKDRHSLVWASEPDMLRYVLGRKHKGIFLPKEVPSDGIFSVTKDTHYSWHIPKFTTGAFDSPERVKCEGKTYTYHASVPLERGLTGSGHNTHKNTVTHYHSQTKTYAGSKKNKFNVVDFPNRFRGKFAHRTRTCTERSSTRSNLRRWFHKVVPFATTIP